MAKPRALGSRVAFLFAALFCLSLWASHSLIPCSQTVPVQGPSFSTAPGPLATCAAAAASLGFSMEYATAGMHNLSRFQAGLLGRVSRRFELPSATGRKGFTKQDWAYFEPITSCPEDRPVTKYGGSGDGSKLLCKLREALLSRTKCVIYSLGSNGNFQFEDAMLQQSPCEVHTFDCTYDGKSRGSARHHYHKWCVGPPSADGDAQRGEFRTWDNITRTLGHTSVDLLKADIEGWEYSVLGELRPDHALPDELAIETHIGVSGKDDYVPHSSPGLAAVFLHLANLGYAAHSQEINAGFPWYGCEFSFIRFPNACKGPAKPS